MPLEPRSQPGTAVCVKVTPISGGDGWATADPARSNSDAHTPHPRALINRMIPPQNASGNDWAGREADPRRCRQALPLRSLTEGLPRRPLAIRARRLFEHQLISLEGGLVCATPSSVHSRTMRQPSPRPIVKLAASATECVQRARGVDPP